MSVARIIPLHRHLLSGIRRNDISYDTPFVVGSDFRLRADALVDQYLNDSFDAVHVGDDEISYVDGLPLLNHVRLLLNSRPVKSLCRDTRPKCQLASSILREGLRCPLPGLADISCNAGAGWPWWGYEVQMRTRGYWILILFHLKYPDLSLMGTGQSITIGGPRRRGKFSVLNI